MPDMEASTGIFMVNKNQQVAVVVRTSTGALLRVLDSASYLSSNVRKDFDAMQPKWFIEVEKA